MNLIGSPLSSGRHTQAVLIVGAGPVGLVAACELARQGVTARVIDALPQPTTQYRAVGVQPRSQEMLAALGALGRIQDLALPQVAIEIDAPRADGFERLARIELTDLPSRYPSILNLPQTDTEAVLRQRAGELGIAIERAVELTGLTMDDTGVGVTLSTPNGSEATRVDWIIGADGAHSTVRRLVGSKLVGTFEGSHFILADVAVQSDYARDTTRLFAAPNGLTVMLCMRDNRTRLMFQIPDPGDGAPAPTLEDVQLLAHDRMGPGVRVYDPESITHYGIHHAQIPQYRVNRALLAGDAAHIHSPAGGQGMNTGMQDAANLAWKLALVCRGLAEPQLLDSYHTERHPIGAEVVRLTTAMATGMTLSGALAGGRNAAMKAISHISPLRHTLAQTLTEVAVGYLNSPITAAAGKRRRHAPQPGAHATDLPGPTSPHAEPVHIDDLLRTPGHVLLTLTDEAHLLDELGEVLGAIGHVVPIVTRTDEATPGAIVDPTSSIAEHYAIGPKGLALIRPDGYFGYLSTSTDPQALQSYLTTRLYARTTTSN
ncbi:MAG TPA: FAD-dependent monooxygenase [Kribbella sp.]|uniref:FAD-dependent monooxygenase n=1 Tax=Kribbella sp. TaxID=1871183 RepID=UPI002D79212C|nr:FAD-dependent monooxygenase [Kribbella sp.]HET6293605.1 FAD-dependent monooxygenase [Kribbella sp.]